ncbi:biopolymer transporter ExbD [Sphingomonas sp. ASV193]|uniref:ExbD/TolR family protein n=1 Tax=Sphingomonas sp. ASV193 TaxID=3144405 RepID=UPI0032E8F4BD
MSTTRILGDPVAAPISELNTTPLIDVMLVLLVMLIMTVPAATHKVPLDLPQAAPSPRIAPLVNTVGIDRAGGLRWNGEPVGMAALDAALSASARREQAPEIHLAPAGDAPYATVDAVLAMARRDGVERLGFVGNGDYAGAF